MVTPLGPSEAATIADAPKEEKKYKSNERYMTGTDMDKYMERLVMTEDLLPMQSFSRRRQ